MALNNIPEIFFIRHGETDWNAQGRYQGRQDIPLNERGQGQADANGPLLRDLLQRDNLHTGDFNWYVSPLSRTRETMDRIRSAFDHALPEPNIDDRLIEISFGKFEGFLHSDLMKDGILKQGERGAEFWNFRPEEGENYADVTGRIHPFITSLEKPSIIVAHGGIARVFRHVIEGFSHAESVNWPTPQNSILHFAEGKMEMHESEVSSGGSGVFSSDRSPA